MFIKLLAFTFSFSYKCFNLNCSCFINNSSIKNLITCFSNCKFRCLNNKLTFRTGILTKQNLIICDKVVLVHTNKSDYDLEIIIITTVNFKNKSLRKVDDNFLRRYPAIRKNLDYIKVEW